MGKKIQQRIEVKEGDELVFRSPGGTIVTFQYGYMKQMHEECAYEPIASYHLPKWPPPLLRSTAEMTLVGNISNVEQDEPLALTHFRVEWCNLVCIVPKSRVAFLGNGKVFVEVSDTMTIRIRADQVKPCTAQGEVA